MRIALIDLAAFHGAGIAGLASIYIGHNRRKVNEDGSVTMFWRNADRLPTHPVDPRIGILKFTGADGRVLALLVNYACHAVVLGPTGVAATSDLLGQHGADVLFAAEDAALANFDREIVASTIAERAKAGTYRAVVMGFSALDPSLAPPEPPAACRPGFRLGN